MAWTLTHHAVGGDVTHTLAEWGLSQVSFNHLHADAGSMTAMLAGDAAADLPFTYGDRVTLKEGSTTKFVGVFTLEEPDMSGNTETVKLTFSDPWWYFANAQMLQAYHESADSVTKVVLFATLTTTIVDGSPVYSWTRKSLASQIAEIVAQCVANFGAVMQVNALTLPGGAITPPSAVMESPSLEQALRACLGYVPGAVTRWDYSTTPPTLQLVERSAATTRTWAAGTDALVKIAPRPRHDMKLRGVHIFYLTKNADGETSVLVDSAGESNGAGIVRMTHMLATQQNSATNSWPAQDEVREKVDLVSEVVGARTSRDWWVEHGAIPNDASEWVVLSLDDSDIDGWREYISGGIPNWIEGEHLRVGRVKAELAFKTLADPEDATKGFVVRKEHRVVTMWLTDLTTGEYSHVIQPAREAYEGVKSQQSAGETPVYGLAAYWLAQMSVLQYDGEVRLIAGTVGMGDLVRITGARTAWATMDAQVTSIEVDVDSDRVTVGLGPARHLAIQDYLALLKALRTPVADELMATRVTTPAADPPDTSGGDDATGWTTPGTLPTGGATPRLPTELVIKADDWETIWTHQNGKIILRKTGDNTRRFQINVNDGVFEFHMPGPEGSEITLKPRKAKVCEVVEGTTVEKEVLIFMSDAITGLDGFTLPTTSWPA